MAVADENIAALRARIGAPLLGVLEHGGADLAPIDAHAR